jgi:hypothetical protein
MLGSQHVETSLVGVWLENAMPVSQLPILVDLVS